MNIMGNGFNKHVGFHKSPFASQTGKADSKGENNKTISGIQVKSKQMENQQSYRIKNLDKQIQRLQEAIEKIKQDEKLSTKEKQEQIGELQKQQQELQKQMIEIQQKHQEEELKQRQEKTMKEELHRLSPDEQKQKAEEINQKSLSNLAIASEHIKDAESLYHQVNEYTTMAKLGMGSKYGGNLSVQGVNILFTKASQYGMKMMGKLEKVESSLESAAKATQVYGEYKRVYETEKKNIDKDEKENNQENKRD